MNAAPSDAKPAQKYAGSGHINCNELTPLTGKMPSTLVEAPPYLRAAYAIMLGLSYISISGAMILFNKCLMREDRFPFPICLTTMHMSGSLTFSLVLYAMFPSFFPSAPSVFCREQRVEVRPTGLSPITLTALLPFAPIAACGAVTLVTGNWAYRVATVSFLQMVKESHILIVYILMVAIGLDKLRVRNALVLMFVACCAAMAVSAQTALSLPGLCLQMVCGLFGSMQIVLTNQLMTKSGKGRIDPMTMVLCVAPMMLLVLAPANLIFWDSRTQQRIAMFWPIVACNIALAFTLQVMTAVTIRGLSALGFSLASVLKDLGIVFAASLILHESLTGLQILGFAGSIFGIGLYSTMKLFPDFFDGVTPSPSLEQK